MATKICTKCCRRKSMTKYYKNKHSKDGLQFWCKTCFAEYVQIYRRTSQGKKAHCRGQKVYGQTPAGKEVHRRAVRVYLQTTKGKEATHRASMKRRERYPEKVKAKDILNGAVRVGKMRPSVFCEMCGLPAKTEGHHPNYNKPLEVEWLCKPCHVKLRLTL